MKTKNYIQSSLFVASLLLNNWCDNINQTVNQTHQKNNIHEILKTESPVDKLADSLAMFEKNDLLREEIKKIHKYHEKNQNRDCWYALEKYQYYLMNHWQRIKQAKKEIINKFGEGDSDFQIEYLGWWNLKYTTIINTDNIWIYQDRHFFLEWSMKYNWTQLYIQKDEIESYLKDEAIYDLKQGDKVSAYFQNDKILLPYNQNNQLEKEMIIRKIEAILKQTTDD